MKRFYVPASVAVALLAAVAFAPSAAQADYKCARPSGSVEQRACEMAAAGPDVLRRFVLRTRGIYNLDFWDFVQTDR
jgi:hypothetical protein